MKRSRESNIRPRPSTLNPRPSQQPLPAFSPTCFAVRTFAFLSALDRVDRELGGVFADLPANAPAFAPLNLLQLSLHFLQIARLIVHRRVLPDSEIDLHIERSGLEVRPHFTWVSRMTSMATDTLNAPAPSAT